MTVGRLGAVLGNIAFGFLIDTYCEYLFFGMSGILVGKYMKHLKNKLKERTFIRFQQLSLPHFCLPLTSSLWGGREEEEEADQDRNG